ncbi:class E sortase [Lentzea sp. E54]|uniref:class E sortase n=1 Tax=Lentzea xerophila TaxID=3435883 RepID=UPI003DA619DB
MVSGRTAVRTAGELALTAGLLLLLFVAWETWGKAALYQNAQNVLEQRIDADWRRDDAPPPSIEPAVGEPINRLHVPRLGLTLVVVEGIALDALANGPGRYPASQLPGQVGNFAVAGHRSPGIFWNLDQLAPDDALVVETRDRWFVYRVSEQKVVLPTAIDEVAPVPGDPDATPATAMITLTTCHPKWDNYQRLVVHGTLASTSDKRAGRPAELGG